MGALFLCLGFNQLTFTPLVLFVNPLPSPSIVIRFWVGGFPSASVSKS